MKLFKALIVASFVMLGTQTAFADQPAVEQYSYYSHLDIAKVIHMDPVPDVCPDDLPGPPRSGTRYAIQRGG